MSFEMDRQNFETELSFVIPCLNEERTIGQVISRINQYVPSSINYEVIVADHGSDDESPNLARAAGASVREFKHAETVAELRNLAARIAKGRFLCFLDADVFLEKEWNSNIESGLNALKQERLTIIGSNPAIPPPSSMWARFSFTHAPAGADISHLGSAHMLLEKEVFFETGEFNRALSTGEDYEFCQRIKKIGGKIIAIEGLKVTHLNNPKSIKEFFWREVWHGTGDLQNALTISGSKVLLTAIVFAILHFMILVSAVMTFYQGVYLALVAIVSICFASGTYRARGFKAFKILELAWVYYVYFWARFMSIIFYKIGSAKQDRLRQ